MDFTLWIAQNYEELELLRQVYYGGVEHEIRKAVWPFLLGHYKFGMSKKEMEQVREPAPTKPRGEQEGKGPQGGSHGSRHPFWLETAEENGSGAIPRSSSPATSARSPL